MTGMNFGGRRIEILLVEDEAGSAETTMEALRDSRIPNRIHWVEDGEEAITFLRRKDSYAAVPRPDLILLDLNMPRMNGHEVLAIIKQHPDWKRIPVIVMTTSEREEDILRAYDRHANCYVTKPMDPEKFREAIHSIEDFWLSIARLPAA
jgi:two-component system, chemotaxis family, response regulator Rcp1